MAANDTSFKKGRRKTGGRKKGTPNKLSLDFGALYDRALVTRGRELARRTRKKLADDEDAAVYYLSRMDEAAFDRLMGKRFPRVHEHSLEEETKRTLGDWLKLAAEAEAE